VKIHCGLCGMLVGFIASVKAANLQYPRGCPVCTKHTTAESTVREVAEAVKEGVQWADEAGNVLKESKGKP